MEDELDAVPPRPERLEELDELEPVVSLLDGEVLLFCAMAVDAISAAVMQNSEVLSNTFFIMLIFSFLLV